MTKQDPDLLAQLYRELELIPSPKPAEVKRKRKVPGATTLPRKKALQLSNASESCHSIKTSSGAPMLLSANPLSNYLSSTFDLVISPRMRREISLFKEVRLNLTKQFFVHFLIHKLAAQGKDYIFSFSELFNTCIEVLQNIGVTDGI